MSTLSSAEIGQRIKELRKEKGFSQQELADKLHKSLRTVQKYETGEIYIPIPVLNEIAFYLGTTSAELIGDESDEKPITNLADVIDLLFKLYFELTLPAKWLFSFGTLLVVIAVLTIIMYYIINQYAKKEEEYRYKERILRDSAAQVQELRGVYDSLIRLRHDMRSYVNDIHKTLEKGDLRGSYPYLNALEEKTANLFSTGNSALDSVLSVKLVKMQENNIEFRGSGLHYTGSLSLDDYALCSLISNMLDNAIEALIVRKDQPGEHFISLKFNYTASGLFIICENPLLGISPAKAKQGFRSRKEEPYHGIGISIMQKIAEDAKGQLDVAADDLAFHVLAFIPIQGI